MGIIIILFISYIIVQQQDVVSKKTPKVQNMVWPTIQLHGRQIHDYVVSITLVHSMTGHSVVTYHNTLSNNASIDVIIRFYIIIVQFSNELTNVSYFRNVYLYLKVEPGAIEQSAVWYQSVFIAKTQHSSENVSDLEPVLNPVNAAE